MKPLVVRLLVCGLCVQEKRAVEARFRAADSERGQRSVLEHMLDDHAASVVNSLLNSWENR